MRSRIMYIEDKSGGLIGQCRIGRVRFSKTGASLYYEGRTFQSLKGNGFKSNYFDVDTGAPFWISGPRRDGADGLYGRLTQPEDVDADVADAYWRDIRGVELSPTAPCRAGAPSSSSEGLETYPIGKGRSHARVAALVRQRQVVPD
jgi:hypothetical protein